MPTVKSRHTPTLRMKTNKKNIKDANHHNTEQHVTNCWPKRFSPQQPSLTIKTHKLELKPCNTPKAMLKCTKQYHTKKGQVATSTLGK